MANRNTLRQSQYPLAGSSLSPSVYSAPPPIKPAAPSLSAFGQSLTPPAVPNAPLLPGMGSAAGSIQQAQNQANQANNLRYGQGLGVLTGGQAATQQSIQNAINSSQNYGQSAQQKLNLQLQQNLGQQAQSAVGRGLENTTIADTMKDLPTRQYNDASAQVSEMAANRMSGLYLNQANANQQGAGSIASYIAGRNDSGPDLRAYTQLAQQAAAQPQKRVVSTMSGAPPSLGGFLNNMTNGGTGDEPAGSLKSSGGGGGGGSSSGAGGYFSMGGGGSAPSATQGYTGSTAPMPSGSSPDQPSQVMQNAGYGAGSVSIKNNQTGQTASNQPSVGSAAPTPAAQPASVAQAMAPASGGGQGFGSRNPDNGSTYQKNGQIYATIGGASVKWSGSQWVSA